MSMTYAVSSALTDEEAYLYAILQDHSGLDLAEFSWFDGSTDDGCFRAWPFQFSWWRDRSPKQIDQCGRAVGKSLSIKARMFVFPFRHPGQEAVITAPELIHLEPIINLIEDQFYSTRLGREMLQKGRSAVTHRPFMMNFRNSARLMGRIPQKDGKGVKGIHPLQLELDEAQDYPRRGWTELNATLKSGFEGSEWRAHGVTRGVRDKFYEYTQDKPGNSWKVHRMTAMHRPNWTDQEREDSIQLYGGHRDDPDYRRNIVGKHGDATNPLFVVTRLYSCVDDDESSDYNSHEYVHLEISDLMVEDLGPDGDVTDLLLFPDSHRKYETTWCGMDVGYCVDEKTEILTQRGWLRYDEVQVGDESLAINPATGQSEWQSITEIFREHRAAVPMITMRGQTFSSCTTPNHRWLVKHETRSDGYRWRWKTTETLNTKDRIPLTVPRGDAPIEAAYSDEFVELAAWYWTEGEDLGAGLRIGQSLHANPDKVQRITDALTKLYGEPGPISFGPNVQWETYERALEMIAEGRSDYYVTTRLGVSADAVRRWRTGGVRTQNAWSITTRHEGTMAYFYMAAHVASDLRAVVQTSEKVVSPAFLIRLTLHQLELFIRTSIDGDGWRDRHGAKIDQASEERIRVFEMACALLGQGTSTRFYPDPDSDCWHMNLLTADNVGPVVASTFPRLTDQAMTITDMTYAGVIWCPKLRHSNWLARREGSVYFTGNTHDPSEILVWGEYHLDAEERKAMANRKKASPKVGLSRFKLLSRVSLKRVPNLKQVRIILGIIAFYGPKAFGLDKTGVGLPLFQDLLAIIREEGDFSAQAQAAADIIKGYNFSAKVIVDIDDTIEVADEDDQVKEAGIHRNVLEQSTDALRGYVDTERLWLPWDDQLLAEFEGQTFSYSKSAIDQFGRARRVFCVDEETMAYTRTGWKRHDELTGADELLTLNPTSGLSEWQPPTAVNVFPGPHKMVLIESATHSSLTTMDHRWLVERYDAHHKTRNWEWRTTDTLRGLIRVPRAAQPSDLPLVSKWTDDFVELVAWLFSEGSGDSGRLYDYKTLQFGQSTAANPLLVDRIRGLLRRLTGSGPGPIRNERHPYNEFHDEERGRYVWRLSRRVSGEVKDAAINAPTMDVRPEFLQSLTRAQLDLFIEVAFLGDGDGMTEDGLQGSKLTEVRDSGYLGRVTRCLGQGDERRLASFEMACIIAGRPVNRQKPGRGRPTKAQPEGAWRYPLSLLHASHFNPADAGKVRQHVMHLGLAWCPTTPNRTWLAMRDGKVYFTGNSEGRFHALDAARMFAMAHSQQAIEAIVGAKNENEAVIARFFQPGL